MKDDTKLAKAFREKLMRAMQSTQKQNWTKGEMINWLLRQWIDFMEEYLL